MRLKGPALLAGASTDVAVHAYVRPCRRMPGDIRTRAVPSLPTATVLAQSAFGLEESSVTTLNATCAVPAGTLRQTSVGRVEIDTGNAPSSSTLSGVGTACPLPPLPLSGGSETGSFHTICAWTGGGLPRKPSATSAIIVTPARMRTGRRWAPEAVRW